MEPLPPSWILSLVYWVHMLATILWLGSLAAIGLILLPLVAKTVDPEKLVRISAALYKRMNSIGWLALVLLTVTGLVQMSANPNYEGFLQITNRWAVAIFIKHIVIIGMGVLAIYQTWWVLPAIERVNLRLAKSATLTEDGLRALAHQKTLLRINLLLALVVLALTALARVS